MNQTRGRKRRRGPGWVPDQHGAWAMITIPPLSGIVIGGFDPVHIALLGAWWIGYLFFQATMLWLKSRKKPRYFPPVRAYGIAVIPFGAALVVFKPYLMFWALAFLPLIAASVWLAAQKRERSVLNDSVMVLAAALLVPVAFHTVASYNDPRWTWVWLVCVLEFAYFWGTIPHVKALIRERNRPEVARGSFVFHVLMTVAVAVITALGWLERTLLGGWFLVGVWALLALRAWMMPWWQRRTRPMRPMTIGLIEVVFSLLVAAGLLL